MGTFTYSPGPKLEFPGDITTKTIVQLADGLHKQFPDCKFEPELICEGGLVMTTWKHKPEGENQYKTMRFHFSNGAQGRWCWLEPGVDYISKWRQDPAQVIFSPLNSARMRSKVEGSLFLKAFYGAPCWNIDELRRVKQVFEDVGFNVTRMPTARALCAHGDLGTPK
jgi:hypothetical protein